VLKCVERKKPFWDMGYVWDIGGILMVYMWVKQEFFINHIQNWEW
jgi:hypothetical protein